MKSKNLALLAGAFSLSLMTAGQTFAQDTQPQTTTTTTVTTRDQNGNYTIIEYPSGKEITVDLSPTTTISGATGKAIVLSNGNNSTIKLNLSGLPGDATSYNVYAVDPSGNVTMLGPVTVSNGVATQTFTTSLNKFMLFVSPEGNLTTYEPSTNVVFRSAVPTGMIVVPYKRGKAITATGSTSAYNVPMIGAASLQAGVWHRYKVKFTGPLAGSNANLKIRPRQGQTAEIHVDFHHLTKNAVPAGTRLVLWAVSPDNTYTRLGQVVDTDGRGKANIHTEMNLRDFGLFFTTEGANETPQPGGPLIGTIVVG